MSVLSLAIQRSGRLHADSLGLLADCGIRLEDREEQLRVPAQGFPLHVFYLRNSDIPQYLQDGAVDTAIIGENLLVESGADLRVLARLGFARCRLSVAVPNEHAAQSLKDLDGAKIATSYPETLGRVLEERGLAAEVHRISGSVEIAPGIGLAEAVCDLVSSGNTLFRNHLREVEVLLESEALLVAGPGLSPEREQLLEQLLFRVESVLEARRYKYILMNVPNEAIDKITRILPVLKSPSLMPLAEPGWSSLHSVIEAESFWKVIDELKAAGAQDILVCPIEKMVR